MSQLQRELKQRKPFQSVAQEALLGLMRTTDMVRRQVAAVIEPHGITLQQYNVLRILRGGGTDGVPTLDIADRMIEQTPGITRLLDRLSRRPAAWTGSPTAGGRHPARARAAARRLASAGRCPRASA